MLLPVYGKPAVPLDLFEADGMPRLFELDCGSHRMLGVFNWEEQAGEVTVRLRDEATHVFDVWSGQYLGKHRDAVTLSIPSHGCALLGLRAVEDVPQVVGSSFHLLQGAAEITGETWDGRALSIGLRPVAKAEGDLFVAVPAGMDEPHGHAADLSQVGDGVWRLRLRVDEEIEIRIDFG